MTQARIHPPVYADNPYLGALIEGHQERRRILIGVPMTGLIRSEWHHARVAQYVPCNWSSSDHIYQLPELVPLGFSVADARNVITHTAVTAGFEWLFFNDSDTILPPECFIRLNEYMRDPKVPVVCGLYFAKCDPPEPLVYRGRGNSYFRNWKLGDKVWLDGIPMGCTLIHVSLLKAMHADAPWYMAGGTQRVKQVFDTPKIRWEDPESGAVRTFQGTEDLAWCDRVLKGDYLKKAGFAAVARRKYPFLCDTRLFCWHIREDGVKFPLKLEW